jgi:hypothetical protein
MYDDETRINFGDQPNQHVSAATAEAFLRIMFAEHKQVFGAVLAQTYTGSRYTAARSRSTGEQQQPA